MRHNLKAAAVSALAIMAALAMSIPPYAADKKLQETGSGRQHRGSGCTSYEG